MAGLNKVFLMGNLTRDVELRYIPSGTAVTKFGMAVNRKFKLKNGESQEEVLFVDVTVWGRQAETSAEYLQKGSQVLVEGRLQLEQWETTSGDKRSKVSVVADGITFMSGTTKKSEEKREEKPGVDELPSEDDIPF